MTSLRIMAPASMAALATSGFEVSIEISRPRPASSLDDRDDPFQFLLDSDRLGSGPGRLSPDIDDPGPGVTHRDPGCDRIGGRSVRPSIGEGVGGDIEHPHQHAMGHVEVPSERAS